MVSHAGVALGAPELRSVSPAERQARAEARGLLRDQRAPLADAVSEAIVQQLDTARAPAPTRPAGAGALTLTLIEEAQIDEDIETARIVEAIATGCDAELRQVTALASGLRGLGGIESDAMPLSPQACAAGLRAGLAGLGAAPQVRLVLLRQLGASLAHELRGVYQGLSDDLKLRGVSPAQYRVRHAPSSVPAGAAPAPVPAPAAMASASAALMRLVERAQQTFASDAPAPLRLLDEPLPAGRAAQSLEPAAAVRLMERLLAQVEHHLGDVQGAPALMADLRGPARELALSEAQLWSSLDHPWWRFLDRLITLANVHDDADATGPGMVNRAMALVVRRMRESGTPDRAACRAAADGLERASARHLQQQSSSVAGPARALEIQLDGDEMRVALRDQLIQQLRSTPVSAGLHAFFVGPWAQAMSAAALRHGLRSAEIDALALTVDDLIRASARPGRPASIPQRAVLMRQAREGLSLADLVPERMEAELAALRALLDDPQPAVAVAWDEPPIDNLPVPDLLDMHAGLPTVPIVAVGTNFDTTMEAEGHASWLDSLQPGVYCRLFLLGRWTTAQLSWMSASGNLLVFAGRRNESHSLTRRMLVKLRNAGLATSIEDGFLLAQAMDTLAQTDLGAG